MNDKIHGPIQHFRCKTKAGNSLSLFYNPENDLLVVDMTHVDETVGSELVRMTLNEKNLLSHRVTQR